MSKKRKKRKTGRSENIHDKLKDKVLALLNRHMHSAYTVKQVTKKLGFRRKDYNREIPVVLSMLAKEGKVHQLSNGSYKSNREPDFIEGRVDHVNPRFAYVIPDEGEDDIYVRSQDLNFAMDGVRVRLAADKG
jgi:ribonuclease R